MTPNQRLKRIDKLEKKIQSSFMPSYRKVKKILQKNRDRVPVKSSSNNKISPCPWNDLRLSNETVEGYII